MNDTTEGRFQQECFTWHWNEYPEQRGLLCYNLNNSKNKIDGALNKSKGLIPGRSDLVFYWNSKATMIELKTETGTQDPAQKKWQETIENAGFDYHIVRTFVEFKKIIHETMQNY